MKTEGRRRKKGKGKAGTVGRSVGSQVGRISRLNIAEYSFVSSSKLGYEGAATVSCWLRLLLRLRAAAHRNFNIPIFPRRDSTLVYIVSRNSCRAFIRGKSSSDQVSSVTEVPRRIHGTRRRRNIAAAFKYIENIEGYVFSRGRQGVD